MNPVFIPLVVLATTITPCVCLLCILAKCLDSYKGAGGISPLSDMV